MPIINNIFVTGRYTIGGSDFAKSLIELQYLARILKYRVTILPELEGPSPDPGPYRSARLLPAEHLNQEFLFHQLVTALKDSPYPQPSIPIIQELRRSKDHIQLLDEMISSLEGGIKYLKSERTAFKKALSKKG